MNINDIVPARIYSWVFESSVKMNKGGRAGVTLNPLFDRVTQRAVYAGQAATGQMYVHAQLRLNPTWQPSVDYAPRWEQIPNYPCVVKSLINGAFQARILNPRTTKREFFVDGKLATADELDIIKSYLPARKKTLGSVVKIMFPYVEKLVNLDGELTVTEDTED